MKQVELKGIIVPIVTPMHPDTEDVNIPELRRQIERQIAGGVHGIFVFGTNGEGYILDMKEKEAVLEAAIDQVKGRVPVYAGTGCISTRDTIYMSRRAQELGADVLSIITPSFAAASQNELYEHYKAVAEAVDMPIVLDWEIPASDARTANGMDARTLTDLQRHFCGNMKRKGYRPMVYFNWHQSETLYYLSELEDYEFWLALYQDRMTYPWRVEMWQYSDSGSVPGINGPVDLNVYLSEV